MSDFSGGAVLHLFGIAVLLIILLHPKTKAREASAGRVAVIGVIIVGLGVAVNSAFSGGSIVDQLTFERVSYGSFFVSLGYALAIFAVYLAMFGKQRGQEP